MLVWQIYIASNNKIYLGLNTKCLTFLSFFKQIRIFFMDFHKFAQYQVHKNPSSGSRTDMCGQMDRHGKSISAFLLFL